ncbi:MAG: hypothetical protein ABIX37_05055 [Gammaproteobacteria bacterium]
MSGQSKSKEAAPGWPSFPATLTLPGLLDGLKVSQWWQAPELAEGQQKQLAWLVNWAAAQVPYYEGTRWARTGQQAERPDATRRRCAGEFAAHVRVDRHSGRSPHHGPDPDDLGRADHSRAPLVAA